VSTLYNTYWVRFDHGQTRFGQAIERSAALFAAAQQAGVERIVHLAAENACGTNVELDNPAVPRPIYTDPEIASVGLTEAQARDRHGDEIAVGKLRWLANARAVMQNETTGWVKSIHRTLDGELLGLVIVGPHATDMVEAGVIAIDTDAPVEAIADGIAPHPTLSEAIKGAGLVALGRAIDLPSRRARVGQRKVATPDPQNWPNVLPASFVKSRLPI
jgi:hypothetical protein